MPRWLVNLVALLIVAGIPPFLVLSNVFVFMTPQYLDYEYGKPDFPKADRFNDKDRRYFASESILYESGDRSFEQFKDLGVYQDRELNHMVDVRVLVAQVTVFEQMDGLLLVVLLLILATQPATRAMAPRALLSGALLTLALFGLLGLFAGTAFNTFFTDFHRVFFSGDTWLFNYSDSLIQFYPERFWYDTAIALLGITLVEAIIVAAIGWLWGRKMSSPNSPSATRQEAMG